MSGINAQAQELNETIRKDCPAIYHLLSEKGRGLFFPKTGIVKQTGEARGKALNATAGMAFEDDLSPMRLKSIDALIHLDPKQTFTYAPSYGKPELRKAWQDMIYMKNPSLSSMISLPIVTNALTNGLSIAGLMFVNPGDKILVTDKFWGNYRLVFENWHGGEISTFNTFAKGGFDVAALKRALNENQGKQILLLNFPNNPAGYTPTHEETQAIADVVLESAQNGNEIVVIADDAYFGLVFEEGVYQESVFAKLADLHDRVLAVKIDGATKEDYVWGFRVGFITYASKCITSDVCIALEEKTAGAVRGNISNASHLGQSLVLHAFQSPDYIEDKESKYALMKTRFEVVRRVLAENGARYASVFTPLPHNSGYFMCVQLNDALDAEKVRKTLLDHYDTGLISVGNMIRIAYSALPAKVIPVVFENLYKACLDHLNE